ncbi:fatty acid desaturase [Leptospira gomenensis]|uniref:Fatty acid desaturase n=1 Tax=Leptospira gomenensis TaxID=2484974 RepID=A0A5F1Y8X7_9LEPT|nr:fatty acid desaturase [Leptospira gomenensis]TGK31663.1 fatty acid desaturase [Leptospira gomenensis]TGK41763.1 fatty acid desaturase [Leptospira gomenensis]TGK43338.1 fatty acid desaturase [Leptospira gomenensis]TGK61332.1 fatty acid desaturase [Leptospira gomenensis]
MSQIPLRDLPVFVNRLIAALLCSFFIILYFWNFLFGYGFRAVSCFFIFVSAFLSYTLWALIHECIHGNFSNSRTESRFAGRVLCILFGTPFQVAKTAHLIHHKFNRSEGERIEFLEKNGVSKIGQSIVYYGKLFYGTYFLEAAGGFLLSLPLSMSVPIAERFFSVFPAHRAFFKQIQKPEIVRELRFDSFCIFLLFGSAFYFCGSNFWILTVVLILRGSVVSFLDHSYHYGKEVDDPNSAYNLGLPIFFSSLFLNFNLHRVHHRFPGCPWNRLPSQFEKSGDRIDLSLGRQSLRQLRGLLPLPEKS